MDMNLSWTLQGCIEDLSWTLQGCIEDLSWTLHGCIEDLSWMDMNLPQSPRSTDISWDS